MYETFRVVRGTDFVEVLSRATRPFRAIPGDGVGVAYRRQVYELVERAGALVLDVARDPYPKRQCPHIPLAEAERRLKRTMVPNLSHLSMQELAALWFRCVACLADPRRPKKHDEARRILERIDEVWFKWPQVSMSKGGANRSAYFKHKEGVLSFLGYRVGNNGVRAGVRRSILKQVVEGHLPPLNDSEYMRSWGRSNTVSRLRKVVWSIHSFMQNALNNSSANYDQATSDWRSDLAHLRKEYYERYRPFDWSNL